MEKRSGDRANTNDDVTFCINGAELRGRMLNLSREGCMISRDSKHGSVGDAITVTLLDGVTAPGEIMWVDDSEIGARFDHKLGEATVKYFLLGAIEHARDESPVDRFGRGLPPMRPDPGMSR